MALADFVAAAASRKLPQGNQEEDEGGEGEEGKGN